MPIRRTKIDKNIKEKALQNLEEDQKQVKLSGDEPFQLTWVSQNPCDLGKPRVLSYSAIKKEIKDETPLGVELAEMFSIDLERKLKQIAGR